MRSSFCDHLKDHSTFDFGVECQDQDMAGDVIDFRVDNMWGPLFALVFHY